MKITVNQLKKIIKEEISKKKFLKEGNLTKDDINPDKLEELNNSIWVVYEFLTHEKYKAEDAISAAKEILEKASSKLNYLERERERNIFPDVGNIGNDILNSSLGDSIKDPNVLRALKILENSGINNPNPNFPFPQEPANLFSPNPDDV